MSEPIKPNGLDGWKNAAINGTSNKLTVLPTKFPTAMEHERALPKTEVHDYSSHLPVDEISGSKEARQGANFDEKVYMFPPAYNALREELDTNYPQLFAVVGHAMAFDAVRFIELMDAALDIKTTFDSDKVNAICHRYLNRLRNMRGLGNLSYGNGEITT